MNTKNTILLALLLSVSATASARAEPAAELEASPDAWTFAVAPRIGLVIPTSRLGMMAAGGLEVDVALPVAGGRLLVALDASLTRPDSSGTVNDARIGGAGDYDIAVTEFKVGLLGVFRLFGPDRPIIPYAGLGPVIHMLHTKQQTSFGPGPNKERNTELGFEVVAGADFRAGPGYVLGEARVVYSDLDHRWTGDTNAGGVTISAGYRLTF
jgi:hypothetical protein